MSSNTKIKQKTIIQVWGAAGGGKSSTIKILNEELIAKYINPGHKYSFPLSANDISFIHICAGAKVGIESMGDYLNTYNLRSRLDDYVLLHNCDIIICASRVYNDVSKHVEFLAKTYGYRLLKVTNHKQSQPSFNLDDLNQLSAKHLLDLTDQVIIGKI